MATRNMPVNQCSKPTGWLGRFTLWRMNSSHSKLTDWGLGCIAIENHRTILDVGCGGGRAGSKLTGNAAQGKSYGVDYSEKSGPPSKKTKAHWIALGPAENPYGSRSPM